MWKQTRRHSKVSFFIVRFRPHLTSSFSSPLKKMNQKKRAPRVAEMVRSCLSVSLSGSRLMLRRAHQICLLTSFMEFTHHFLTLPAGRERGYI